MISAMKRELLLLSLLFGLLMACSCVNLKKIHQYPEPQAATCGGALLPHDGSMDVGFTVRLPEEYRNTNTGIRFEPYLGTDGSRAASLPPFVIEGRNNEVFNERMGALSPKYADDVDLRYRYDKDDATLVEYQTTVAPVEGGFEGQSLYADLYADAYTRSLLLGRYHLGCIPDLSGFVDRSIYERFYYGGPAGTVRIIRGGEEVPVSEGVTFAVNSDKVKTETDADMAFREYFKRIVNDPELAGYNVIIYVSNSPEGSVEYNRELGERRMASMLAYAVSVGIPEGKCKLTMDDENWNGLLAALPTAGIENRAGIEEIIRNTPDPDEREKQIRRTYPADHAVLMREVYPTLRRGDITITAAYKGEPGVEYKHTYATTENSFHSFVLHEGNQTDISAIHDAMLDAVKQGNFREAEKLADRIPNSGAGDAMLLNKSTVYAKAGRTEEAKALLKRLAGKFPEARYNLGTLQLIDREYEAAEENLDGFIGLNTAISDIYMWENDEAIDVLLLTEKSPQRDYLLAMAYARKGKTAESASFLSQALENSPELRAFHSSNECSFSKCGESSFERAPLPEKVKKTKEPKPAKVKTEKAPKEPKVKEPKPVKEPKVKEPKPEKVKAEKAPKEPKVKEPKPEKEPKVKEPKPEKVKAEKAPKEPKVKEPKPEKVRAEKAPKEPKVKEPKPEKVRAEKTPKPEKEPKVKAPKPEKAKAEKAHKEPKAKPEKEKKSKS